MIARALPSNEFVRQRWRNGLGWTREIIRSPDTDDYGWRASIAEIDHDCTYSPFPGYLRLQVLLDGAGLRLRFADGEQVAVQPPHGRHRFGGEQVVQCSLLDGPVRAFNLIHRPGVQVELLHRPLVGSMVFFCNVDTEWLIYLLRGTAMVKHDRAIVLEAGDALHIGPGAASAQRCIVDGGGELLAFRLQAAAAPPRHRPDESR